VAGAGWQATQQGSEALGGLVMKTGEVIGTGIKRVGKLGSLRDKREAGQGQGQGGGGDGMLPLSSPGRFDMSPLSMSPSTASPNNDGSPFDTRSPESQSYASPVVSPPLSPPLSPRESICLSSDHDRDIMLGGAGTVAGAGAGAGAAGEISLLSFDSLSLSQSQAPATSASASASTFVSIASLGAQSASTSVSAAPAAAATMATDSSLPVDLMNL
jgi:hypothetical protein